MLDELKPDIAGIANNDGERAAAVLECVNRKLHVFSFKSRSPSRILTWCA